MHAFESILIKKYKKLNQSQWIEIIKIMEKESIEGKYYRDYVGGTREQYLFIGLNIDQKLMNEFLIPFDLKDPDRLDVTFYTPLLEHVVETMEKAYEKYKVPKWKEFLEMWNTNRKEIINPNYREETNKAGIYGTPFPECPWIQSSNPLHNGLNSLEHLIFDKTIWYPVFLVNIDLDDKYFFEKGAVKEAESDNKDSDEYSKKLLNVSHFTLDMVLEMFDINESPRTSLLAPGWPIDLLKMNWDVNPKWFPKFMKSQGYIKKYLPRSIEI